MRPIPDMAGYESSVPCLQLPPVILGNARQDTVVQSKLDNEIDLTELRVWDIVCVQRVSVRELPLATL